jgi:hypothetical protein
LVWIAAVQRTQKKELNRFFGEAAPPVALRLIEGKPAVIDLLDAKAVKGSGVVIGDVVLAVDGEPVDKRMARYGKYIAGSNPSVHARSILRRLLNGAVFTVYQERI